MTFPPQICTLPKFSSSSRDLCRQCDTADEWRCDNGFCIANGKVQNGIKDCPDGSDELHGREHLTLSANTVVFPFLFQFLLVLGKYVPGTGSPFFAGLDVLTIAVPGK